MALQKCDFPAPFAPYMYETLLYLFSRISKEFSDKNSFFDVSETVENVTGSAKGPKFDIVIDNNVPVAIV